MKNYDFVGTSGHASGKWTYLRILQDTRLIAAKKQNLENYSVSNCD